MWKRVIYIDLFNIFDNIFKLAAYGNFNTSGMEIISIFSRKLYLNVR